MINEILTNTKKRMEKSLEALKEEFKKLRSGRASSNLLDQVMVSYYGSDMPLNQVANVSVEDSRTLSVTPFDKSLISTIEKAIINSALGLNPTSAGTVIRVPLPPLTEERRKEMVKIVRGEAEGAKVALRNIRRDANGQIKDLLKDKEITKDEERKAEESIQSLTDEKVKEVEKILLQKETDLMEV